MWEGERHTRSVCRSHTDLHLRFPSSQPIPPPRPHTRILYSRAYSMRSSSGSGRRRARSRAPISRSRWTVRLLVTSSRNVDHAAALLHDVVNVPKNHADRGVAKARSADVARGAAVGRVRCRDDRAHRRAIIDHSFRAALSRSDRSCVAGCGSSRGAGRHRHFAVLRPAFGSARSSSTLPIRGRSIDHSTTSVSR